MHFLKCININWNFLDVSSYGSNEQYSSKGSDNGLGPTRWQAIIWTNDGYITDAYMHHLASMILTKWMDEATNSAILMKRCLSYSIGLINIYLLIFFIRCMSFISIYTSIEYCNPPDYKLCSRHLNNSSPSPLTRPDDFISHSATNAIPSSSLRDQHKEITNDQNT